MPAALFDLDGTLVDTAPGIHHAVNELLTELGEPTIPLVELKSYIGRGVPALITDVLARQDKSITPAAFENALARFNQIYTHAPLIDSAPYPGVGFLLQTLVDLGWSLGVCTNKPLVPTRTILAQTGLDTYLGAVVGGDCLPVRKPDPAPAFKALRDLDAVPESALFIGDSHIDSEAARNAGLQFCLFDQGYGRNVDDISCDLRFDRFSADLADTFLKLLG